MQENKSSFWSTLYRYKVHHILLWTSYFAFWTLVYRNVYPSLFILIMMVGIYFAFNAAAFYTTAYYLFPRFLYKQKVVSFLGSLAALIIGLSLILGFILHKLFDGVSDQFEADFATMFQWAFLSISTMTGLLAGAKLVVDRIREGRADRLRDQQRLESELQYLKAQVNPHFLFNAINSIYFLIKKSPDQAAETLIRLSDLLRFQLYDCSVEKIDIGKELMNIQNFIALEQIRKGEKVKVTLDLPDGLSGFEISPFLLIPFVENAFKHVSNSTQGNTICIEFKRETGRFLAAIENTTDNLIKNEVGGIGLKNVKRRLELLYPGKHALQIVEHPGKFKVHLSLDIA
jgi:sensor histidine kinase YesM